MCVSEFLYHYISRVTDVLDTLMLQLRCLSYVDTNPAL